MVVVVVGVVLVVGDVVCDVVVVGVVLVVGDVVVVGVVDVSVVVGVVTGVVTAHCWNPPATKEFSMVLICIAPAAHVDAEIVSPAPTHSTATDAPAGPPNSVAWFDNAVANVLHKFTFPFPRLSATSKTFCTPS